MERLTIALIVVLVVFVATSVTFVVLYENRTSSQAHATPDSTPVETVSPSALSFKLESSMSPLAGVKVENFGGRVSYSPKNRCGIITQMVSNGTSFSVPQVVGFTVDENNKMTLGDVFEIPSGHPTDNHPFSVFFKELETTVWVLVSYGGGSPVQFRVTGTWRFINGAFTSTGQTNDQQPAWICDMTEIEGKPYRAISAYEQNEKLRIQAFNEAVNPPVWVGEPFNYKSLTIGTFDKDHNYYGAFANSGDFDFNSRMGYGKFLYDAKTQNWVAPGVTNYVPKVNYSGITNTIGQQSLQVNPTASSFLYSRSGLGKEATVQNTLWFYNTEGDGNFRFAFKVGGSTKNNVLSGFSSITDDFEWYAVPSPDSETVGHYLVYNVEAGDLELRTGSLQEGVPASIPYTHAKLQNNYFFKPCIVKLNNSTLALFCTNNNKCEMYIATI